MKRILALMLALLTLTLCGCSAIIIESGSLNLNANDIDHIKITNGGTEKSFSISDRETISAIVRYLNSYTLENGTNTEASGSYRYRVTLVDQTNGSAESHFYLPDTQTLRIDGTSYAVNTKDLMQYVEARECDTLTDNELIDALLEGDTLNQLNIIDDEGNISFDKILSLPQNCPALFELMSRSTAIQSVGSYGADKINAWLNSNNPELVEKAQEWIEVLKKLIPDIQEKLENLIKNQ